MPTYGAPVTDFTPRWQHAELVARPVGVGKPGQLAPRRVELLAATALGDARRDTAGIVSGLEPDVEVQPVLGRALADQLRAQLKDGSRCAG